jgi:hypothetical protein
MKTKNVIFKESYTGETMDFDCLIPDTHYDCALLLLSYGFEVNNIELCLSHSGGFNYSGIYWELDIGDDKLPSKVVFVGENELYLPKIKNNKTNVPVFPVPAWIIKDTIYFDILEVKSVYLKTDPDTPVILKFPQP